MPTYDFYCSKCDILTEVFRSMTDRNLPVICEKCNLEMERRIGAGCGIIFRGTGWTKPGNQK